VRDRMIILRVVLAIIIVSVCSGIIALIVDLATCHKGNGFYEKFVKRPLDCFLATGALIVLSPVLLITTILVRVKLGSPVLFSQERPGLDEKVFKLHKFRTMTDSKDGNGNSLPDEVRLTSFGKKLRSTSLDELPELLNIIKGEMAVVGPRPLLVKYLPYYTEEQHKRHSIRPGLTGYAQAHGRNEVSWDDKFAMDVEYASHVTFLGDARIFLDTVISVFKHEGISSSTSATMEDFTEYCKSIGRTPTTVNRR